MSINEQAAQIISVLKQYFKNKRVIGIEIGTRCANCTVSLLEAYPLLRGICTIDTWKHFPGAQFVAGKDQAYHDEQKKVAIERLALYSDRVKILNIDCNEAYKRIAEKVDFVWIDGHHTYEQVKKDILNYMPLIKSGGMMGGHDYGTMASPGVKEAVDEIFIGKKIYNGTVTTWWVILD